MTLLDRFERASLRRVHWPLWSFGIMMIFAAFLIAGCEANTSGNVDIDADDMTYVQDERTKLCFGIMASRKSFDINTSGLGVANVPCSDAVLALIED